MNNKGFSFIELLITITVAIPLVFTLIVIPANLLQDYKEYGVLTEYTSETRITKSSIVSDLEDLVVTAVDENNLVIGNSSYNFANDGLYRIKNGTELKLSSQPLEFQINNLEGKETLRIYGENTDLEFSIGNSSFEVRE